MTSFDSFYRTWHLRAKVFAREFLMNEADAENIVQDVFLRMYERRELFDVPVNMTAYLFAAIKNACLNHLKKQIAEREAYAHIQNDFEFKLRMSFESLEVFNTDFPDVESIENRLQKALDALPERCRQIIIMSKLEGKKRTQIAEELNVSIHTVERQRAVAYQKLREELKDCYFLFLFLFALP